MLETIIVIFLWVVVVAAGIASWWMDNHSNVDSSSEETE